MKTMELGRSGILASKVALGTISWGSTVKSPREARGLLDCCLDHGINYIDTAPVYGTSASEELVGAGIEGRRDRFVIQTKCGLNWRDTEGQLEYVRNGKAVYRNLSPAAIRADLEDSLRRLRTDYVDILMTHRQSVTIPRDDTIAELLRLKDEGKIRAIGVSNVTAKELKDYLDHCAVAVVQQKYSIVVPHFGDTLFPICRAHGVTFQTWGVFESGTLVHRLAVDKVGDSNDQRSKRNPLLHPAMKRYVHSLFDKLEKVAAEHGCSVASVVLAYTSRMFENMSLLVGASKISSIADTCKALEVVLDDNEFNEIKGAVTEFLANIPADFKPEFPVNKDS